MHNISSCTVLENNQDISGNVNTLENINEKRMQELENFAQEYKFCINKDLSQIQRFELLELLQEFKDVFARSLFEIKQYPHYELELDLLSKQRAFRRQFRLHPEHAETVRLGLNLFTARPHCLQCRAL